MKTKAILIGALGLASIVSSCKKEETASTTTTTEASQSETSTDKLTELTILSASANTPDSSGRPKGHCKITEVETSALPSAVATYITTYYSGATIEKAGKNEAGDYLVAIKKSDGTVAGLKFDSAGNFQLEKPLPPKPEKGTPVEIANLPSEISTYITDNYSGATIEKAHVRSDGNFVVLIKKSVEKPTALAFDSNGSFLAELPPPPKGPHGGKGPQGPGPRR